MSKVLVHLLAVPALTALAAWLGASFAMQRHERRAERNQDRERAAQNYLRAVLRMRVTSTAFPINEWTWMESQAKALLTKYWPGEPQ